MIRHLYLRIYLTTLLALSVVVLLYVMLSQFSNENTLEKNHEKFVKALISKALPVDTEASPNANKTSAVLAELLTPAIKGVSLFDQNGKLLASAGEITKSLELPTDKLKISSGTKALMRTIVLDDGRAMMVELKPGINAGDYRLNGHFLIALIAIAVGISIYPVIRRLTRGLELLAKTVDSFGHGELTIRAQIKGRDEVSILALSFNAMAERVQQLVGAHSRMLINASHELRSPLARMRLALTLYDAKPQAELMESILRDCTEIDEQIEEILLASKLETLTTTVLTEIVELAAVLAEECSRLKILFEMVSAPVRGDERLLRRLIRNLLENALKYGKTEVTAEVFIDQGGARVLQVRDRGPGVALIERGRIFEPFYRPAGVCESGNGWGLGLALVKQIAEHHQGKVSCHEREGGGCLFEVQLPLL